MARYLIFARKRYEDPLQLHGELDADDAGAAPQAALTELGEGYIEVRLVPDDAIRWIVRPGSAREEEEVVSV